MRKRKSGDGEIVEIEKKDRKKDENWKEKGWEDEDGGKWEEGKVEMKNGDEGEVGKKKIEERIEEGGVEGEKKDDVKGMGKCWDYERIENKMNNERGGEKRRE